MRISAVVLNWRRPQDTIAAVRSLRETAPEADVIVVDNASGDGSVDMISAGAPFARIIQNPSNLGYAGGNNTGIAAAVDGGADAVFVLNNDAIVRPGCVQTLAGALEENPRLGIAAPVSLKQDDPEVVDFYRARVDLRNMALLAYGRDERGVPTEDALTDYATGSAMLIRSTVLRRIGMFDERFFLVWEDVDFCLRAARAAHARAGVVARAQVLHGRSVSFGGEGTPRYQYFFVRNSFLVVAKHVRRPWKGRTRALLERRYRGWLGTAEPAVREAIALGLEHGLAGRFGPTPPELA